MSKCREEEPKRAPRVTVEVVHVVAVSVQGEYRKSPPGDRTLFEGIDLGPLPRVPDDGGVIGRLLAWMGEEGISTTGRVGSCGAGSFFGLFVPADAERVVEWLENAGVEQVEYHPERPGG